MVLRAGPHPRDAVALRGPGRAFLPRPETFSAPRFKALYRMWKQDGDVALAEVGSRAIHDAFTAGSGVVETLELGHRYGHLCPLVNVA